MENLKIEDILSKGIKYVAIDFDDTLIKPFNRDQNYNEHTFVENANMYLVNLMKNLISRGINVGIASFATYKDLIEKTIVFLFGHSLPIASGRPLTSISGKEDHIYSLFGTVPPYQTLLIDDLKSNITIAKEEERHTFWIVN